MTEDLFVFKKFMADADPSQMERYYHAAMDKLQILYPGKRITSYDYQTIGIESDSVYSDTGVDIYELGMIDDEVPALRRQRDDHVITFNCR